MVPGAGGGRQPGAGRPPDAWKAACKAAASKQEVFDIATEILNDKSHPLWLSAWKFLAEQGYGKPEATSNVNVNGQQVIKVYAGIDPAKDV
mgnify:CR=1 FL=1